MHIRKSRVLVKVSGDKAAVRFLLSHLREATDVAKVVSEILEVARGHDISILVLNFSHLKHVSSSLLSKLVTLNTEMKKLNVSFRVCGLNSEAEKAFRICHLNKLIPIHQSEADALGG
jgi:anti-anti-sigma factor